MLNDWSEMARAYSAQLREVRAGIPDVMKGFSATARAALKPNAMDGKTKELVALGIAVAIRCDPCIAFTPKPPSSRVRRAMKCWRRSAPRSTWAPARA